MPDGVVDREGFYARVVGALGSSHLVGALRQTTDVPKLRIQPEF